jgi:hypothetical protein
MTIKRLDHVSVVVDDLAAAMAFFTALGMTHEGETPVEGPWVDRVNGLERVQVDIVMMRTPDGHGRLELTKFRNPKLVSRSNRRSHRRTRWASGASCLQSKASTTLSLAYRAALFYLNGPEPRSACTYQKRGTRCVD